VRLCVHVLVALGVEGVAVGGSGKDVGVQRTEDTEDIWSVSCQR